MATLKLTRRSLLLVGVLIATIRFGLLACWARAPAETSAPGQYHLAITERAGLEVKAWPIIVRLPLTPGWETNQSSQWRVVEVRGEKAVYRAPFQILDTVDAVDGAGQAQAGLTFDLCFPVTLKPFESRAYELDRTGAYSGLDWTPQRAPDLAIVGSGAGAVVDSGPAVFGFHPRSGQLAFYSPKMAGITNPLGFQQGPLQGALHHNPDVWAPPQTWGHTSDWNFQNPGLTPNSVVQSGPLLYRFIRKGLMPNCPGVKTWVSYTVLAGQPVLLESSSMEFTTNLTVNAVRNNELVFNRGIHTHAAYAGPDGKPVVIQAYDLDNPSNFYGRIPIPDLSPDIPWVALVNRLKGYGIGMINLDRFTHTGSAARPLNIEAYYYFNDYGDHGTKERFSWNFLYLCRAEIFAVTTVPAGSIFAENSAVLAFKTGSRTPDELADLDYWTRLLNNPPACVFKEARPIPK